MSEKLGVPELLELLAPVGRCTGLKGRAPASEDASEDMAQRLEKMLARWHSEYADAHRSAPPEIVQTEHGLALCLADGTPYLLVVPARTGYLFRWPATKRMRVLTSLGYALAHADHVLREIATAQRMCGTA